MQLVEVVIEGEEFLFRVPDLRDDMLVQGALPLLDAKDDQDAVAEKLGKDPQRVEKVLASFDEFLCAVSVNPKLVNDPEVTEENAERHVRTRIPSAHRINLVVKLREMAGAGREDALEIRPFSETNGSSGSSISSPADTDNGRRTSSEAVSASTSG